MNAQLATSTAATPYPRPDEAEIIARLRTGDEAAFEELVRTHGRKLLALCRRLLSNEEDARDVVQETFVAAFRSLDGFRADARLGTWLSRIAVNYSLMRLRSRRRKPEQSIEELLPKFLADGHQTRESSSWGAPADRVIERQEVVALVRGQIDRLPERYRTVLLLRDIEELDTESVAKVLGVTHNTVKVRLHRARQALRGLLEPHFVRSEA
ncbi:MAG TPA: sigma-70 family RNA polymerase sigma factor [Vicinamibacteria bacterium]|nr:sigma-70 family RNA polymerase sigma factor [Vicinamibacteria bacterium]